MSFRHIIYRINRIKREVEDTTLQLQLGTPTKNSVNSVNDVSEKKSGNGERVTGNGGKA